MSQENSFDKPFNTAAEYSSENAQEAADPETKEILALEAAFEGSGEYARLAGHLDSLEEEIAQANAFPSGSDERAQAAYAIKDKIASDAWKYEYVKPVSLWNEAKIQQLRENERFAGVLEKLEAIEARSKRVLAEATSIYDTAVAEREGKLAA